MYVFSIEFCIHSKSFWYPLIDKLRKLFFILIDNQTTYFIICQVSVFFCSLSLVSWSFGWASDFMCQGVDQIVRSSVGWDSQYQLVSRGSSTEVKFNGGVDIQLRPEVEFGNVVGSEEG